VKTGKAFWEKNYVVNLGTSGALQATVAEDVARALGISIKLRRSPKKVKA